MGTKRNISKREWCWLGIHFLHSLVIRVEFTRIKESVYAEQPYKACV